MALCGLMAALSVVILTMGGLIPLATYACPILAMVCTVPVLRECGVRLSLAFYAAVSLLALLLAPDKELAFFYVFFGYYPILRPCLDRLKHPVLRIAAKCCIFTAAFTLMYLLILFLFRLEAVVEEFSAYSPWMVAGLLLLGVLTLLFFDRALGLLSQVYDKVIRKRFFR